MKKSLFLVILAVLMLVQSACSAVPSAADDSQKITAAIEASDEVLLASSSSKAANVNVAAKDKAYVRGGSWANKNWHQINEERIASGTITREFLVIKNGMSNDDYTRVGLFKYDISKLKIEDIGYATFNLTFTDMAKNKDVYYDIYWVDDDWSGNTVTWNTKPDLIEDEPLIKDVLTTSLKKADATEALKTLVKSGQKTIALMVVQRTNTDAESRISSTKANELTYPFFTIYKDPSAKDGSYIKQLVVNEEKNQAIWDYAAQMFDEWYVRYETLRDTPLAKAELIVSDAGQYNKTSTSPGSNPKGTWKTYQTRTFSDLTDLSKYVDANAEVEFDKYGGIVDESLKQEATGFYYTKKLGERWWVIDPLGYPCYIRALSGITYSYQGSPKQREAAIDKFGTNEKWAIATTRHLINDLYFNAGASPANEIKAVEDGIAWQGGTSFMSPYGSSIGINNSNGGSTTFSENNTMPVWDPDFVTYCDARAAANVAPLADDPSFLGYTTDNELPMQASMIYDYMNVSPAKDVNYYSYACTWYWVVQMTGKDNPTRADITPELEQLFRGFVWDRYYYVVCNAVRAYDQNHMILGTRFLTAVKDAPWVLRFASLYLDCITVNWYGQWEPAAEDIYDFASNADLPFMVTEFYAKAEENEDGLANTTGAGFFVRTQQDRADHYQSFTLRLLEAKNCVGWHWFQYTDNDPTGNPTDTSSIDANKGIVSNTHTEYTVLTDRMKEINKNVYMLIDYFDAKYAK